MSLRESRRGSVLDIDNSVYAYLGRGSPEFGTNGFTLPIASRPLDGSVSPFDSGGLVEHIQPIQSWDEGRKKKYLEAYSWSQSELPDLMVAYPTVDRLANYVDGVPPEQSGPHQIWAGVEAGIWAADVNSWRAWTWELRSPIGIPAGYELSHWTCPPHVFMAMQDAAMTDETEPEWYLHLAERYIPGGVSQIVRIVRDRQATP